MFQKKAFLKTLYNDDTKLKKNEGKLIPVWALTDW